jgi:hypothetical protein
VIGSYCEGGLGVTLYDDERAHRAACERRANERDPARTDIG